MENPKEERRPYAPSANVIAVLRRARTRNLPPQIDDAFFNIADVPKSAHGLVRETLLFLELIDSNAAPTSAFEKISASSDAEFRTILEQVVRSAYADDFAVVDPSTDSADTLVNNFRRYKPRSVTDRMRMLFTGLCRESGIPVAEQQKERRTSQKPIRRGQRIPTPKTPPPVKEPVRPQEPQQESITVPISHLDILALDDESTFLKIWESFGKLEWSRAQASVPKSTSASADIKQLGAGSSAITE